MQTHLTILTGASRGMGLAMAEQLLQSGGNTVLCIARHPNDELTARALASGARLLQWSQDLARPIEAAARLEAWLREQDAAPIASVTLINNAALLTPPGPVDSCNTALLSDSLRVGLEAPMLLTAAFLRATRGWHAQRRVLNISSGLGRRAMAASAPYCAAKAGLDNFSAAVALDEARQSNGARIASLAPGVIDTDMQTMLRAGNPEQFPDREMFVKLKSDGQLSTPAAAAARVLAYLARSDFGAKPLADVRDP